MVEKEVSSGIEGIGVNQVQGRFLLHAGLSEQLNLSSVLVISLFLQGRMAHATSDNENEKANRKVSFPENKGNKFGEKRTIRLYSYSSLAYFWTP